MTPDPTVARIRTFQENRRAATEEARSLARERRARRLRVAARAGLVAALSLALAGAYELGVAHGRGHLALAPAALPAILTTPTPAPASAPNPAPASASAPAPTPAFAPNPAPAPASASASDPETATETGPDPETDPEPETDSDPETATDPAPATATEPAPALTHRPHRHRGLAPLPAVPHVIHLTSTPAGAEIIVDHQPTGLLTPATFEVHPDDVGSMVEVDLRAPGHRDRRVILSLRAGFRYDTGRRVRDVSLTLEGQAPRPQPIETEAELDGDDRNPIAPAEVFTF